MPLRSSGAFLLYKFDYFSFSFPSSELCRKFIIDVVVFNLVGQLLTERFLIFVFGHFY